MKVLLRVNSEPAKQFEVEQGTKVCDFIRTCGYSVADYSPSVFMQKYSDDYVLKNSDMVKLTTRQSTQSNSCLASPVQLPQANVSARVNTDQMFGSGDCSVRVIIGGMTPATVKVQSGRTIKDVFETLSSSNYFNYFENSTKYDINYTNDASVRMDDVVGDGYEILVTKRSTGALVK